jgi:DNA-binding CsgD family transcriptional regulator/PAS domain-containing protein
MHEYATTAAFSDLIGLIYDCAVDPGCWPRTLEVLRRELHFANATLTLNELPSGRVLLNVTSGIDSPWVERMPQYGADIIDVWGGPAVAFGHPLDRPAVVSRINPAALREATNPYVRDWAYPQGIVDAMAIPLARDASAIGTVGLGRHRDAPPIGDREVAIAQLLLPHLQRAAAINRLLESRTAAAAQLAAVLDGLSTPVVVVAVDRTILHANGAARALLDSDSVLAARANILSSTRPRLARALADAIAEAGAKHGATQRSARSIPVRDERGVHAVHILPLPRSIAGTGPVPEAAAAVFVASPRARSQGTGRAAAALFGLTPAEARVFDGIGSGQTPAAVARALRVAPSTVRTHLLRVFAKTGVRRQAELVQLAAALALPLG